MSTREEMLAIPGMSQDQTEAASGDGQVAGEILREAAVTNKARKGARRAIAVVQSDYQLLDADTSTGHAIGDNLGTRASEGDGQMPRGTHVAAAIPHEKPLKGPRQLRRDHENEVQRQMRARIGRGGYVAFEKVQEGTIAAIQSLHREHRAIQRAKGDMERRIKADERWFAVRRYRAEGIPLPDGKFPDVTKADQAMVIATRQRFFVIRDQIEAQRKQCQKELLALVKPLPVMGWVAGVKGLGLPSVAAIIGEAGDLANYSNPGKLWKRMGLAVFDGKAQGKRSDAAEAARHGYNPARRSEMHVVGDCLVRAGGPYADLYRARKAVEMEREGVTKMHAHKRALRYIEKRLLREMWQAWRGTGVVLNTKTEMSPAEELDGQFVSDTPETIAIQDGGHVGSDIQMNDAPVPPIPRKRVPRTIRALPSIAGVSGATV